MKASPRFSLSTCALLTFGLLLVPSAARSNLIFGPQCEFSPPPQCDDDFNNDGEVGVDYDGGPTRTEPDPDCDPDSDHPAKLDDGELLPGFQEPPPLLICHTTIIRLERPQGLRLPEPPNCPECYWIELVDFRLLLDASIPKVIESLPDNWKASSPRTLTTPVPGVVDDPNIPNLRLHYVGKSEILGPAIVGEIKLREPFLFPPNAKYVGRAFDLKTGQLVTNVGTLGPLGTAEVLAVRPRAIMLGLAFLLGIVASAVWVYLSRRRQRLG